MGWKAGAAVPVAAGDSREVATPPSAAGILAGLFLVAVLHVVVSIAVISLGGLIREDGFYVVFGFWIGISILQWLYLYPAIRFFRARAYSGVARGIWIGGGLTAFFSLASLMMNLSATIGEKFTGNTPANTEISAGDARVVSVGGNEIVIRETLDEGPSAAKVEPATFVVTPETRFDFRGPAWRDQKSPPTLASIKAGDRVNIHYVDRNFKHQALFIAIWVEKPKQP